MLECLLEPPQAIPSGVVINEINDVVASNYLLTLVVDKTMELYVVVTAPLRPTIITRTTGYGI